MKLTIFAVMGNSELGSSNPSKTGYLTNVWFSKSSNQRIKFHGSDGKIYFPRKSEIHTAIPFDFSK